MRFLQVATLAVMGGLWANCSDPAGGGMMYVPMPDAGLSGGGINNPEGVDYPTVNIGGQPRTSSTAGQIFPNLTLEGVRSAATMATPAVVSMAEYYDPSGARFDLLHVIGLFMWCPHCDKETSNLSSLAGWQSDHRVAVVQIAMLGYGNASPGWSDLQKWVGDHKLNFPVLVDGQGAQLGQYFSINYVPLNIVVNPRSMEILAVDVGEISDSQAYEQGFLNKL